jgi:hypothetical protein
VQITYSAHALQEAEARDIPIHLIEMVATSPQQILREFEESDIAVYQSLYEFDNGKTYLLRVFVAQRETLHVVTVYRTSKIGKYWRQP